MFLILIFIFCIICSGCGPGLATLKELGAEQKAQHNFVAGQRAKFSSLLKTVRRGKLKEGMTKEQITSRYGQPVLIVGASSSGKEMSSGETFLYRDPVDFFYYPKI